MKPCLRHKITSPSLQTTKNYDLELTKPSTFSSAVDQDAFSCHEKNLILGKLNPNRQFTRLELSMELGQSWREPSRIEEQKEETGRK